MKNHSVVFSQEHLGSETKMFKKSVRKSIPEKENNGKLEPKDLSESTGPPAHHDVMVRN